MRLGGGEAFSQRFRVAGPVGLNRIDVNLGKSRPPRSGEPATWVLHQVSDHSGPRLMAEGQFDLTELAHYDYVSLRFAPISIGTIAELELTLRAPADSEGKCFIEVPFFASPPDSKAMPAVIAGAAQPPGESTRAFLFISPASGPAQ